MEHSMTLVVFTFLSQLAIGGFAALFIMDTYKEKVPKKASSISLMAILIVSVVAVIVSIFHLGHPFAAYKAILNFNDSWLTREIIFFPTFILFVFAYAFLAKNQKVKQTFGWIGTIVGAITILCTAMIYTIPSVPAWNNGTTTAAFFLTALLLGPILIQLLVSVLEKKFVDFSLYTTIIAAIAILVNVVNLTILQGGFAEAVETASILLTSPLFWAKMVFLVVAFAIAGYSILNKKISSIKSASFIFVCFFVAEFIGRMLFYSSGVHL